jgi:hypothetical protein
MTDPSTLREAFERYKVGKPSFGRQDMFGMLVDAIEALQARIGAVDEAAVGALDKRIGSMEETIGNALRQRPSATPNEIEINRAHDAIYNQSKRVGWPKGKPRGKRAVNGVKSAPAQEAANA